MRVKRLTIHRVSDQNFSRMKVGIDLGQSQNGLISIRTRGDNEIRESLTAKFSAERRSQFAEKIGETNSGVSFVGVRMRVVESCREVWHGLQIGK